MTLEPSAAGLLKVGPGGSTVASCLRVCMCVSHLHVELRLAVEEVEEPLVVEELGIPFLGLVIPEVITQWHKEDIASEQPGLLPVLVQEQGCPGDVDGYKPNMKAQA